MTHFDDTPQFDSFEEEHKITPDIRLPAEFEEALSNIRSAQTCSAFSDAANRANFFEEAYQNPESVLPFTGLEHARATVAIWIAEEKLRFDVARITAVEIFNKSQRGDSPLLQIPAPEVVEASPTFLSEFKKACSYANALTNNLFRTLGENAKILPRQQLDLSSLYPRDFHSTVLNEILSSSTLKV